MRSLLLRFWKHCKCRLLSTYSTPELDNWLLFYGVFFKDIRAIETICKIYLYKNSNVKNHLLKFFRLVLFKFIIDSHMRGIMISALTQGVFLGNQDFYLIFDIYLNRHIFVNVNIAQVSNISIFFVDQHNIQDSFFVPLDITPTLMVRSLFYINSLSILDTLDIGYIILQYFYFMFS